MPQEIGIIAGPGRTQKVGAADENGRLRQTLRDLVALSALPAHWAGRDLAHIADHLSGALLGSLHTDFAYVSLAGSTGSQRFEAARVQGDLDGSDRANEIGRSLSQYLSQDVSIAPIVTANPVGAGRIRLSIRGLGPVAKWGWLVVGSKRRAFPSDQESLLLGVAADQATVALQEAATQEALKRREAELEDFFENATIGLHWFGPDGKILNANRAVLELTGYGRTEYVGRFAEEFYEDREVFRGMLRRLQAGGTVRDYEARLRRKDGATIDVLIDTNVLWVSGRFVHSRCFVRDITERKRWESELQASEDRFRLLFENNIEAILVADDSGRFLQANAAAWDLLGYPEDQLLRMRVGDLVTPTPPDAAKRYEAYVRQGGETGEFSFIRPDGQHRTAEYSAGPFAPGLHLSILRDVTEQKRAEEALRKSEERFRHYFELGLIGMAITSPAKGCLEVNDRLCEILGYERAELLGLTWSELTYPSDIAADQVQFERVLRGETDGYVLDKRWIRKDGQVIDTTISAKCLRKEDGSVDYFVALVEDITARKQAEAALRVSEARYKGLSEELDRRVSEQTAALTDTIQALNTEMVERARAQLRSEGQVGTLKRILNQLTQEFSLDDLPSVVLMAIGEQLGAQSIGLWLVDAENGAMHLASLFESGRVIPGAQSDTPHKRILPDEIAKDPHWTRLTGECSAVIYDMDVVGSVSPQVRAYFESLGINQVIAVPLTLGRELLGLLSIRLTEDARVSADRLDLAEVLGHQASMAIQTARLNEQAKLAAVFRERNRFARDIHDTLAQTFTGILMQLGVTERLLGAESERADSVEPYLNSIRALATTGLSEARRSVQTLRSSSPEQQDISGTLAEMVERLTPLGDGSPSINFELRGTSHPLPAIVADNLLRIGQEALTNALRHSHGTVIQVSLAFDDEGVRLVVQDTGRGFDTQSSNRSAGFGLRGMQERADLLGAAISLESQPDRGTRVSVSWRY